MTSTLAALSVALPPISSPDSSLHVVFHNDSALDPAAPIACLTIAAPPSSRTSFLRVALRLEQAPLSPSPLPRSRSRAPESASTAPPLPRPLSPRQDADHVTIRAETARVSPALIQGNTTSKPRSRRCFVCGKQNTHALSFRFCPRTRTLLRRQLAKLDSGRLVLPNGSPLPMTRHAGGIAGHLISQSNAALRVPEHHTTTAPSIRVLPRSTHSKPRTELRLSPPLPRFEPADHDEPTHDSSSPHATPLPSPVLSPKRVPRRRKPYRTHFPHVFLPCNSCTFRKFHQTLLDMLFYRSMRKSLHGVITALDQLDTGANSPDELRLHATNALAPFHFRIDLEVKIRVLPTVEVRNEREVVFIFITAAHSQYYAPCPKPPSRLRPVNPALHREHVASEPQAPEPRVIELPSRYDHARVLHGYARHAPHDLAFLLLASTVFSSAHSPYLFLLYSLIPDARPAFSVELCDPDTPEPSILPITEPSRLPFALHACTALLLFPTRFLLPASTTSRRFLSTFYFIVAPYIPDDRPDILSRADELVLRHRQPAPDAPPPTLSTEGQEIMDAANALVLTVDNLPSAFWEEGS
ncbi:hypothetical protein GGX14DRAFT_562632 [Mycena pura]|uniref:Uncharacterized protein n=1 Tax=Mycena pura TaxID=153505 RepID=A0AAD6VK11_9AGAR|nr:hypothetical protein GGX14DRAFT_562632 [Mycena pura]